MSSSFTQGRSYEREQDIDSTFILLKPCAIARGLIGEVIIRLEKKGLKIAALKMTSLTREKAEELYSIHKGKPFFEDLIQHMTEKAPVVALVIQGEEAVLVTRRLVGTKDPTRSILGTIRGDFSLSTQKDLVHAADSKKSAKREIGMFFREDEIFTYQRADENWI